MSSRTCWVYSEQELTPRAIEVIKAFKRENGYEDVKFKDASGGVITGGRVLVFGNTAPPGVWDGVEFIYTYSIAQIMSKANAVTVLNAAMQMYFNGKHEPRWNGLVARIGHVPFSPLGAGFSFDYDAPIAIDIETDGNLGETHTPEEVRVLTVALYDGPGQAPLVFYNPDRETGESLPLTQEQLDYLAIELPKFTKAIYHNGKFDTRVLNRVLGVKLCVWADTMLMHHTLNHAAGMHGLKEVCQRYFGAEEWEKEARKYTYKGGHYERIPWKLLTEYNAWDVYWTYTLWELLAPQIEVDEANQMAYELEMRYAEMLLDMEVAGIPFREDNAKVLEAELLLEMEQNKTMMQAIVADLGFNPNSPKQVKQALYDLGYEVPGTGKAVIEELMEEMAETSDAYAFCEALTNYRKAQRASSTYAIGWAKAARDGRVHPTFLVHGTSTGRLSSTGPNAQNMPRDKRIRKIVGVTE